MLVDIHYVRAGMTVEEPVYADDKKTLLIAQGEIVSPRMLVILKMRGIREICVDEPHSLYISPTESMGMWFKEFQHSRIYQIVSKHEEGNIKDDMINIAKRVIKVLDYVAQSDVIMSALVEINLVNREKIFNPAVYSCAYSVLVAAAMDLSDEEIYNIACATLLQNLGLCEMPHLLNMKVEEMSEQDYALWQEHVVYGYYFAKERGVDPEISKLIYCHHERFDGKGYPRELKAEEFPIGARIIKLCTDFDRMLFRDKMQPYQVIQYFFENADGEYDSIVVDAFINNIPIYSIGSIVQLSDKTVGVIINIRKNLGPYPLVRICYNAYKKPITRTKVIDLNLNRDLVIESVMLKS